MLRKEFIKAFKNEPQGAKGIVSELFEQQGIILSLKDIKEMEIPSLANIDKEVNDIIEKAYKARKLIQFMDYPVISDIEDNIEIASDVIQELSNKKSKLRKKLLEEDPEITSNQIIEYIQDLIKADEDKKKEPSIIWAILLIVGMVIILTLIGIFIFSHKKYDDYDDLQD